LTVIAADRGDVTVFACVVNETVPFPVPAPDEMLTHPALVDAVHAHAACVVTEN
jgi:hypothetical protein